MTTQHIKQNTPEWLDARRGRITASVVGAILGVAPYMTREEALRRMVRDYHKAEPEFTGNAATLWGTQNEEGARIEFMMETGLTVSPGGFFARDEWAGASPDGLIDDSALIEIKCPFSLRDKEKPEFKVAFYQLHYYAQMQFQMWVTGRLNTYFYQWAPHGTSLELVTADPAWVGENIPVLKDFYAEYLSELDNPDHLKPKRKVIETILSRQLLQEYDELVTAIELGEARKKEILEEFERMAGGRDADIWGRKLTRVERAGSVSYAKVVKDHLPDIDLEPYRGKGSFFLRLS